MSPGAESFAANGGDGTVRVTASAASCAWTAASNAPWISVASSGGSGNGNLRYTVAANTGAARTGTLTVAGATVTVTQAAAPPPPACAFTVSPLTESFGTAGGDDTIRVEASASSCAWTAVSNVPWITVATAGGSGNGSVRHTVAANTGAARTGTLTVAGATVTVTQAAAPTCEFTVSPLSESFPPPAVTAPFASTPPRGAAPGPRCPPCPGSPWPPAAAVAAPTFAIRWRPTPAPRAPAP